jgi:hypothetical protein
VRALCTVAGADQARLLALWDLADTVWPYGAVVSAVAPEVAVSVPAALEYRRWRTAALVAFGVIVLLVAGVLWAWPSGGG